jgi:hypothetical protein
VLKRWVVNIICSWITIRVRSLHDQKYSKTFKDFFCLFSKTFESNQLSKICERKHHFFPVISPVTSHLKMYLFVDICENLALQSIYFISYRKSYNQILTKELILKILKTFFAFSHNSKTFQRPAFKFKDFQGFQRPLRTLTIILCLQSRDFSST